MKKSHKTPQPPAKEKHYTPEGKIFRIQHSWSTDDAYEIDLRRVRAMEEKVQVVPMPQKEAPFRDYHVKGAHGTYCVELRSLTEHINTCSCHDFQKNYLGTCKHIERILQKLEGVRASSPYYELFMSRNPYQLCLRRPEKKNPRISAWLNLYFTHDGDLLPNVDVKGLLDQIERQPEAFKTQIRISQEVRQWNVKEEERLRMEKMRAIFERRLQEHQGKLPFLKEQLYDYQLKGMLHLAFRGRAILADDMGLGKTVQAVSAAAVMKEVFNVRRVLVISPTSLKLEWEEQIRKFTDLSSEAVYGNRPQRLQFYKETNAFFVLMNYEQVLRDAREIVELLRPDLMILDEAQRIKNWTTQTARTLKEMDTPYVFVLTGTPLENRIDDIYSLTEIVDPTIFGSLFRFNRHFYRFDKDGKNIGMQHLDELHCRLKDVMLRRRKSDVKLPLPFRNDRNLFITITEEQRLRYSEVERKVTFLLNITRKRPLRQEEFLQLQMHLATMRMLCDSCYITDSEIKESPKLDEVMLLLQEYFENEPERKIIIFSEWTRMLDLLKERLDEKGIEYVEHTGAIPQQKRRLLLNRFKTVANCRLLLSSEAGGTGLNLQVASIVFNLDLPWNPAKLEQRIARSWRNKQAHAVDVVNFVAENTIEHKMLGTLKFKKDLADFVLDGRGDQEEFASQDARAAFVKQLQELLTAPEAAARPTLSERVKASKLDVESIFKFTGLEGKEQYLAVGNSKVEEIQKVTESPVVPMVISAENLEMLRKLEELGVICFNQDKLQTVYQAVEGGDKKPSKPDPEKLRRIALADKWLAQAVRAMKMAGLLQENDFSEEASESIFKAEQAMEQALSCMLYGSENDSQGGICMETEAFLKMLTDSRLDDAARQFMENTRQRLNASIPMTRLSEQGEWTMKAIRKLME